MCGVQNQLEGGGHGVQGAAPPPPPPPTPVLFIDPRLHKWKRHAYICMQISCILVPYSNLDTPPPQPSF